MNLKTSFISRIIFLLIILTILFANGVHGQFFGFKMPKGEKKVSIEFDMYNNLIVIPVRLNQKVPLNFIIDSGVRFPILSRPAIAEILDVTYERKITFYGAGHHREISAFIAGEPVLQIPGLNGGQKGILVLEENYLDLKRNLGTDVHGILGYDFFRNFVVEIDYNDQLITIHDPKKYKKKWWDKTVEIKFRDNKPFINSRLTFESGDTLNANLLVDTGASHALMLYKFSNPKINLPKKSLRVSLGVGLGGEIMGNLGKIEGMEFGGGHFHDVVTSFPDTVASLPERSGFLSNGSVGAEALKRYRVVFNYPDSLIYFNTNWFYKRSFDHNRSGIKVIADGPDLNQYIVNEVIKGSPGDCAGVQMGDQIIGINWIKQDELSLSKIHEYFHKREGKNIRMEIKRQDTVMMKKFELKNLI